MGEIAPIIINGNHIEAGQNEIVKLSVGRLPSGTRIYVQVHVYRSMIEGPTVLVLGGVHGDEINGVEIVRRSIDTGLFENLTRGSVIAIPLLNIYGFIHFSRDVPDGKDVNRSFPGSLNGSLASRVARTLTKKILPYVDFGVDFHTGGHKHYNYPQVRFSKGDIFSEKLARAFGAPYLIATTPIPKSLRKVALDHGKPIIVYEGGENLRLDDFSIAKGISGIRRLLLSQDMLRHAETTDPGFLFNKTSWVRAGRAGIFQWFKPSGHKAYQGEPLGVINDPYGQEELKILAPRESYIIGHNNNPVVSQGDALFHIGYEYERI